MVIGLGLILLIAVAVSFYTMHLSEPDEEDDPEDDSSDSRHADKTEI